MDANLHTIEGAYSYKYKRYYFAWLGNIWYLCQPCAPKHIICLQALQSLSIRLQTYHSLQTTCLGTYHMFASQLVNPPSHPCISAPWQASNLQFPLQAHWLVGMMEWHLLVTPMLAREDRCISLLPSLFMGGGFSDFLWWVCLPDQHQVSLIYFSINFDSNASWSLQPLLGLYIYNLILGLLLADVAINLHKSSKCKVPSRSKDFVDTATTTSGARAVAFTRVYLFKADTVCPWTAYQCAPTLVMCLMWM